MIVMTAGDHRFKKFLEISRTQAKALGYDFVCFDLGGVNWGKPFSITDETFVKKGYYTKLEKGRKSLALHKPTLVEEILHSSTKDFVYLDADAIAMGPLHHLFSGKFDIAVTLRAPGEETVYPAIEGLINAGVIFFRNTETTRRLVASWKSETDKVRNDQLALNRLLFDDWSSAWEPISETRSTRFKKAVRSLATSFSMPRKGFRFSSTNAEKFLREEWKGKVKILDSREFNCYHFPPPLGLATKVLHFKAGLKETLPQLQDGTFDFNWQAKPSLTVNYFDVGMNLGQEIGEVVRQLSTSDEIKHLHIYGFEPHPECFEHCRKRFQNTEKVSYHFFKQAIGFAKGEAKLWLHPNGLGHSLYPDKKGVTIDFHPVSTISFQEWLRESGVLSTAQVNILKANIEGAEWDLFKSIREAGLMKAFDLFLGSTPGDLAFDDLNKVPALRAANAHSQVHRWIDEAHVPKLKLSAQNPHHPNAQLLGEIRKLWHRRGLPLARREQGSRFESAHDQHEVEHSLHP